MVIILTIRLPEKETVLLVGGHDGNQCLSSLIILQTNEKNFKKLTIQLPYPIHRHGAQFLKNHLYIFGGQNECKESLDTTYQLSQSLKWKEMTKMNEKRRGISNSCVVLSDKIWVLGGWNGKKWLKSVEIFDPVTNTWKFMR